VVVTWMLWWLLLPFSFLFLARLWCGICPLGAAVDLIQKALDYQRKLPGLLLRKSSAWIAGTSFFGLAWAGMLWHFDDRPRATAIILLSLLFTAILIGLVYQRRTWCRYLCPLGIVAALYSMVSFIRLRPDRRICREECHSPECSQSGHRTEGCPMLEYPANLDSNRYCNLCGECVKHCPQRSMRLQLRSPVTELWQRKQPGRGEAIFIMVLMALVFFEVVRMTPLFPDYMKQILEARAVTNYNLLLSASLLAIVGITVVSYTFSSRLSSLVSGRVEPRSPVRYTYAYIPLVLGGYLAAAIQHLAAHGVRATKVAINQLAFSGAVFDLPAIARGVNYSIEPSLKVIQLLVLVLGAIGSLYAGWKIASRDGKSGALVVALPHLALIGVFALSLLLLFLQPMGLLH
jgi:ferredoxin